MDKISVIVPCFNEEEVLPLFYKEVVHTLEKIQNIDYEILFINDGSQDHSEDILKLLAHKNKHCFYYSFSRNFGKEAAMYAGLENASGDYVVIMDADLQHPPAHTVPAGKGAAAGAHPLHGCRTEGGINHESGKHNKDPVRFPQRERELRPGRSGGLSCPVRPHRAAAGRYQNGSI